MQDISKEHVWALRHAAANGSLTGPLATVALCDNLLAAQKERDEAQRNLENIKASRAKDTCNGCESGDIIGDMRSIMGATPGVDMRQHLRDIMTMRPNTVALVAAQTVLSAVREAAGCPMGRSLVDFVAVMRNSADRTALANDAAKEALDAKEGETVFDAAQRVSKEAEGLYRFKLRIREALGVPQGTDMAEAIRKMKRDFNSEIDERVEDFRAVARRAFRQDSIICDIGRIVGAKDLTADGVLAHVKSLPQTANELRKIAANGLGYVPSFLAVGRCEGIADDVLRKNLEAEIRTAIARGTGSPFMRDTLYQLCEEAGIDWPGENLDGVDNIRKAISSFVKARMAEIGFLQTQCEAASKRAKEAEANADDRHDNVVMRQNLAEKTAECEKLQARIRVLEYSIEHVDAENLRAECIERAKQRAKDAQRIQELESTIRANLAGLEAIEELQEGQAKLVATIIRMAEGKRNPAVTVTSKNASPQVNRLGVRLALDPNVSRNTWGFLF